MKKLLKYIIRIVFVSLLSFTALAHAGFDEGVSAYQAQDYALALQELLPLAIEGDPVAQFYIGVMNEMGYGVEKNEAVAAIWYQIAATAGLQEAQYNLSLLYYYGDGVTEDYVEAVSWMRLAAEAEMTDAQYEMGLFYFYGDGVEENDYEALSWFSKAADEGHADATFYLGMIYEEGYGVDIDLRIALASYLVADLLGSEHALEAKDRISAMMNSVAQNDAAMDAAYNLYNLRAFEQAWTVLASRPNIIHPDAQYLLALMLETGKGVEENAAAAAEWYQKAASNVFPNSAAARNLAYLYVTGSGVEQNYNKALELYLQAAQDNDLNATENIAVFFENGDGVPKDLVEAYAWLLVANQIDESSLGDRLNALQASLSTEQIDQAHTRAEAIIRALQAGQNPLADLPSTIGKIEVNVKLLATRQ